MPPATEAGCGDGQEIGRVRLPWYANDLIGKMTKITLGVIVWQIFNSSIRRFATVWVRLSLRRRPLPGQRAWNPSRQPCLGIVHPVVGARSCPLMPSPAHLSAADPPSCLGRNGKAVPALPGLAGIRSDSIIVIASVVMVKPSDQTIGIL